MTLTEFARTYGKHAVDAGQTFRFNPAVVLAVASWESAYGTSNNARRYNNFFGIKSSSRKTPYANGTTHATPDGGSYLHYDSPTQSFQDFLLLLSTAPRYKSLFTQSYDVEKFAAAFVNSGYMTDPKRWDTYRPALISRAKSFTPLLREFINTPTTTTTTTGLAIGGLFIAGILVYATNKYILTKS